MITLCAKLSLLISVVASVILDPTDASAHAIKWQGAHPNASRYLVPGSVFKLIDAPSFDALQAKSVPSEQQWVGNANPTVTAAYPWGKVTETLVEHEHSLVVRMSVRNTGATPLVKLEVQTLALQFSQVPDACIVDYGMFGMGGPHPANQYPLEARTDRMPGVIGLRTQKVVVDYSSDDPIAPMTLIIPHALDDPIDHEYPLDLKLNAPIMPGKSFTQTANVNFVAMPADFFAGAKTTLRRYAQKYPFQVKWKDRRPIGKEVLATSEEHPSTNPRGWFTNDKNVDTSTLAGIISFRKRLLARADEEIGVLRKMGAQGLIVWDVEGEEYRNAVYIGDPRLEPRLAPEMEYADSSGIKTVDLFFKKFRDAGFRVGVALRAERVSFLNGVPQQNQLEHVVHNLNAKLAYARKRWGCTLFYIDSTVAPDGGPNDAEDFKAIADANPGTILFPENESTKYFAYTAPLNSFFHHGVADTPPPARAVWPGAFSIIIADDAANRKAREGDLVASVRHGNILLINSWYDNPDVEEIANIYKIAKQR